MIAWRNDPEVADPRGLTQRERQVANAIGLAHSQQEIAYTFGITEAAVSASIKRAVGKLGLRGVPELAQLLAPEGVRWRLQRMEFAGETFAVGRSQFNESTLGRLTNAEREVALELVRGSTYAAIADQRGTSRSTVANQVQSVFDKLNVSSRVEAALRLLGDTPAEARP